MRALTGDHGRRIAEKLKPARSRRLITVAGPHRRKITCRLGRRPSALDGFAAAQLGRKLGGGLALEVEDALAIRAKLYRPASLDFIVKLWRQAHPASQARRGARRH